MEVGQVHSAKRSTRRSNNSDKFSKSNTTSNTNVRKSNNKSNSTNSKKENNTYPATNSITCYRCGQNHLASKCTLNKNVKCNSCGKCGHLQKICFQRNREANAVTEILQLEHVQYREKIVLVNDKEVKFEIDSGAAVSLMAESLARKLFPNSFIYSTELTLVSYCRQNIKLLGYMTVNVRCCNRLRKLNLYITKEKRNTLLGREWLTQLREEKSIKNFLNGIGSIKIVEAIDKKQLNVLLHKYQSITVPTISKILNVQSRLILKKTQNQFFVKRAQSLFVYAP